MLKFIFFAALLLLCLFPAAQNVQIGIPDSVENVTFPGSTGAYAVSNPLNHNGTSFTNAPVAANCFMNCKSDYLYFHDLGFNVPNGASILGIEVIHTRGGCNQGSYVIDTLHLTRNGAPIGDAKRDSASVTVTDTLGAAWDVWSVAGLSAADVNDPAFGVMINSTGSGICTFGQFDVRIKVYYCEPGTPLQGIPDSVQNIAFQGSTGAYTISNPLTHNGSQFTNPPISVNCIMNCKSDWLYFHDFGFNIPSNANISGFEVIHTRGGCNSGSFVIDTVSIAYGGNAVGMPKRDSTSSTSTTTLGSMTDNWGNPFLSAPLVNDPSFGVAIRSTGTGICTFGQFDVRVNVYYCGESILGMQSATLQPTFTLYPNPAHDAFSIQSTASLNTVTIYNLMGQSLLVPNWDGRYDIAALPKGTYLVVATTADGASQSKAFVKE